MGTVIGDLLPVALGVAISPVPIIAVILMLLSPRAGVTSVGFLLGWVLGIAVVSTAVALLVEPADSSDTSGPSTLSSWIKLVLGIVLVGLAARQWRSRPGEGETPELPAWMSAIDTFTPVRAVGLGALLAGPNPKNLAMCVAAGATVAGADLSASETTVSLVVFVVIAASTVAVPVIAFLTARSRMQAPLDELRRWLTQNNETVMSVLLLVIGVTIGGKGLGGLIGS